MILFIDRSLAQCRFRPCFRIWACGTCTKPRGITEADLIEGAKIVTAANFVEYMAGGAATLSF